MKDWVPICIIKDEVKSFLIRPCVSLPRTVDGNTSTLYLFDLFSVFFVNKVTYVVGCKMK